MPSDAAKKGAVAELLAYPTEFYRDAMNLVNRCVKPDRKEMLKVSQAVAMGLLTLGFIGYGIKFIHIPINNIIVGGA